MSFLVNRNFDCGNKHKRFHVARGGFEVAVIQVSNKWHEKPKNQTNC